MKTENDHINLKVAGQDGSVVQFKIKRHTPLSKLMKAYCERQVGPPPERALGVAGAPLRLPPGRWEHRWAAVAGRAAEPGLRALSVLRSLQLVDAASSSSGSSQNVPPQRYRNFFSSEASLL